MYMIVNGLGKTKNEMSMVTALRAVVVATAVTQPKDSTMPKTEDTPTNTTLMSKLRTHHSAKQMHFKTEMQLTEKSTYAKQNHETEGAGVHRQPPETR